MTKTFKIEGMNCAHCRASVENAIKKVKGVDEVEVSLSERRASVSGNYDPEEVEAAVRSAGFDIIP